MNRDGFGKGKWVFIDWMGIDPGYGTAWSGDPTLPGEAQPTGVELKVHPPRVIPGWVIAPDRPCDEKGISPYASVLEDGGRFHCWYECHGRQDDPGINVSVAYAVSEDGVHWTKPELDAREVDGSGANNLTDLRSHGACVFVDPVASPAERFKTAGLHTVQPDAPDTHHARPQCTAKWWRQVGGAVSADGVRWQALAEPILRRQFCDTQTVVDYDPGLAQYVLYTRQRDGLMKRRGISRSASADFRTFPPSQPVVGASPLDPPDWDYQSHGYHRWPGGTGAHLMLQTIFYRGEDRMGIHLATSRDGIQWHRPQGRQAWLAVDDISETTDYAGAHSCHGILPTAPGEWSVYVRPYHHGHNENKQFRTPAGLMRAVLREDGFVSLHSRGRGEFWTVPFVLDVDRIGLNVKAGFAGCLRVGIERVLGDYDNMASCRAEPITGYGLGDCREIGHDRPNADVSWSGGGLAALRGQTVRLHVQMYQADLFAIRFGA